MHLFYPFGALFFGSAVALPKDLTWSPKRSDAKVVEFELHKNQKKGSDNIKVIGLPHGNDNSSGHLEVQLANKQYYYQVAMDIGCPPQTVYFTIDTGSSDLWVMSAKNPFCKTNSTNSTNSTGINCNGSVFNPDISRTYQSYNTPFEIEYGDHTMAKGKMASDMIHIGSVTLQNATFALADVGNSTTCVFGVGFIGNEAGAHVHRNGSGVYPTYFNIPTLMKSEGIIGTNAYSLWLNDANAESGNILFGGVDRAKYDGDLVVMPVYNNYYKYIDHPIQTRVILNSISADKKLLADFSIAVLLDSGTSFTYLPQELVNAIGQALGFTYQENLGYYFGSIKSALTNVKCFHLNFSGAVINVPTSELLIDLLMDDGVSPVLIDGERQAILAIGVAEDDYMYILGDIFLRSMYAVFDIDHYEIALANAKHNVTDSDIVAIGASIPGAIQAPGYFHTTANNASYHVHSFTPSISAPTSISIDFSSITTIETSLVNTHQPTIVSAKSKACKTITTSIY